MVFSHYDSSSVSGEQTTTTCQSVYTVRSQELEHLHTFPRRDHTLDSGEHGRAELPNSKESASGFPWTLRGIVSFAKSCPRKNLTRLMVTAVASAGLSSHGMSCSARIPTMELDGERVSSERTVHIKYLGRSRSQ
jgi:hypothetical protein